MGNKPPWDLYPNAWRTGSDIPDDPPNYCVLCDRGTTNRLFCDHCVEMMDAEEDQEYEDEPDYEAIAEARAEHYGARGDQYE